MLSQRLTPAMGWNSWNAFGCYGVTEDAVLANADALINLGLAEAGYDTVVVDDGWQAPTRDADGALRACPTRFPNGMKALGERLHERGLKFGMYLAPGRRTCAQYWDAYGLITRRGAAVKPPSRVHALASVGGWPGLPSGRHRRRDLGSWQREREDLAQLVDWGIDLLKYDWCHAGRGTKLRTQSEAFGLMSRLIDQQEREIHYSLSGYGRQEPWRWAPDIAHSWRTTSDITRSPASMLSIARATAHRADATRPGAVQDPDMLQVGNLPSNAADRTHMLLWAMLAAPLMIGCDLSGRRHDDPAVVALRDPELIALDQHPQVRSARLVGLADGLDCYEREVDSELAFVVVNTSSDPRTVPLPALREGARAYRVVVDGTDADPGVAQVDLPPCGSALVRAHL